MKESGLINKRKATAQKYFPMDAYTKVSILMENPMGLVPMSGQTVSAMMVNG